MHELRLGLAVAMIAAGAATAAGQTLPGYAGGGTGAQSEWAMHTRAAAERVMLDWVNLTERNDAMPLAAMFTDHGVFVDPGGEAAEGRDAVRQLLERLPPRSDVLLQVTGVAAGTRLMNVAGRVAYVQDGRQHVHSMVAVLEQHRDYWMFRLLALGPMEGAAAAAPLDEAIGADRTRPRVPQRAAVRFVVEPAAVRGAGGFAAGADPWVGFGASVGVELDRTLELRLNGWRMAGNLRTQLGPRDESLAGIGAELRAYALPSMSVRPFVQVGLARLAGYSPDSAAVPQLGGGVAARVMSGLDVQLSVRDYLVASNAALYPSSSWFTRKREHRPLLSLGLSYSTGRPPVWHDVGLSELDQRQQASQLPGVLARVSSWAAAVARGATDDVRAMYSPFTVIYRAGQPAVRGAEDAAAFWVGIGQPAVHVVHAGASGNAAFADAVIDHGPLAGRRVFTVFERAADSWSIASQVVR